MILGNICTRACRFCHVKTNRPLPVDLGEPARLSQTVQKMNLKHVVITSVTRDDLSDRGANHFKNCLVAINSKMPQVTLEVLTPDFSGKKELVEIVATSPLKVFNHNIETVERLTPKIRSGAKYWQSLKILTYAKQINPNLKIKTGLMLGLGETIDEVKKAICDAREAGVEVLTIGQYLRPTVKHHPVVRYANPLEFNELKLFSLQIGFTHVESGALVRSSYHAEKSI